MTDEEIRTELRRQLTRRVGGFFHNTRKIHGVTCLVCAGPVSSNEDVCSRCAGHRAEFGDRLADRVLLLTYVRGQQPRTQHQSAHTVRAYKWPWSPVERCLNDLRLMVLAATRIHARCVAESAGRIWDSVTFVPSRNRPGAEHPVAELARHVAFRNRSENRLVLEIGPGFDASERVVRTDQFVVPDGYRERVMGKHVLLVDDTWTSGAKMQSAAVALSDAGAEQVTALCVARWCRHDWPDHRELLDSCAEPYDAFGCPVLGEGCSVR
ncbi:hypothetical protein FHR84_004258 [Actinopolyspora biskrensis]|uniref:Amidophosphoribosyltransferase n=1 Tax=Actinopolyspora biskrensis TaxID=1470178 RepID=A0A852ZBJ5_9ACTN|nr:hypothetical protein [Actinopolyspora biskrensis]